METSVSVVIPFYKGLEWLIDAVESVLRQTYSAKEIIVINDGSKENIDNFLNQYGDSIIYIYKENGGPATARNLGIEKSTGEYIAFLDSDDIWLPTKLEKQVDIMLRTNCIWSHTNYETFNTEKEEFNTLKEIKVNKCKGMIYPQMIISNRIATPCVMIKGDFLRQNTMLRFNNNMRYGQDQYLWINIALEHEILVLDEVLTRVRMRGSNASVRARVQIKARTIIWKIMNEDKVKFKVTQIPILTKFAFKLSTIGNEIITFIDKYINSSNILEIISRIVYIIPWILFKVDYKINTINKYNLKWL